MKKAEQKLTEITLFLDSYINKYGYPPSYREIASGVSLKSINSVKEYLDILEQRNIIRKQCTKNRCIELISNTQKNSTNEDILQIPVIGDVAAGTPILAEQNIEEYISVSQSFFGKASELFMLRVHGQSMIEIGINDGDYVVAKKQNNANNGDVVVAMIDNSATVKTFYKEQKRVRLQPQNANYEPIYATEVSILGKVVGCLRRY